MLTHVSRGFINTSDLTNDVLLDQHSLDTLERQESTFQDERLDASRSLLLEPNRPDGSAHGTHPTDRLAHSHLRPRSSEAHFQATLLPASIATSWLHQNCLRLRKASNSPICCGALRQFWWKAQMYPMQRNDAPGILWRSSRAGL